MNRIEYKIAGTDNIISIRGGSLFEQEGLKIVHCPRTFDTSPEIVPSHSVYGQFLKLCELKGVDVDSQIEKWIGMFSERGKRFENKAYRSVVFDVGELCPIMVGNEQYCISAFSNTNSIFNAESLELGDYIDYWNNLWQNLASVSVNREIVCVAVPGDRLVNVATAGFLLPQKIAVIVNSFLHNIKFSGVCKQLNICLYGRDADSFDYEGWEKTLLPFLDQLSHLPLEWTVRKGNTSVHAFQLVKPSEKTQEKVDVEKLFFDDLREMTANIEKKTGEEFVQFEGSKKVCIIVEANTAALYNLIDWLENQEQLTRFFIRKRGDRYDKNGLFQFIGAIHDCTNLFGKLNRKSVVKLSLNATDDVPERWSYLGDSIDNIINYVGQRLADLKKNHINIYNIIRRSIPLEYRKLP